MSLPLRGFKQPLSFQVGGHRTRRRRDGSLHTSVTRVTVLYLYTKLEVCRPSLSKDMADFRSHAAQPRAHCLYHWDMAAAIIKTNWQWLL